MQIKEILKNYKPQKSKYTARNAKEDLINQIADRVERIEEKEHPQLRKRLAIASNTLKWDSYDLHNLLNKQGLKNYVAFVYWSLKIV